MPSPRAELQVELVPVARLHANPANPRRNDAAVPHVMASIRRFGFRQPIVAKHSGELIVGHTRLRAAIELGMTEVPVHFFDGTDLDATAFGIADNRSHEFSTWDPAPLAAILKQLQAEDAGAVAATGFSTDEIDKLLKDLEAGPGGVGIGIGVGSKDAGSYSEKVDDAGPEPPSVVAVSRPGDLWLLGEHRLLCGDSTKAEDVARVLAGEKAVLFSTDPPYCVQYTGNDRPVHDGKPSGKDWSNLYREVDIKDLGEFLDALFSASLPHLVDHAPLFVWHAHVQQPTVAAAFERHGLLLHQVIVWIKPTATFGHSYFRWRHEPVAFGWKRGFKPAHGFGQYDTVWECDWEGKARVVGNEHPMQKPLRLFELPMEIFTQPGDVCLEPFSGSGSQLLAGEKMKRRVRAIEITPAFCDADIRRFRKATGVEAKLEATGRTYAETAEERGVPADAPAVGAAAGGAP